MLEFFSSFLARLFRFFLTCNRVDILLAVWDKPGLSFFPSYFFSFRLYIAYIGAELGLAVERWKRSNDPVDVPGSVVQLRPESIGDIESTTAQTSLFFLILLKHKAATACVLRLLIFQLFSLLCVAVLASLDLRASFDSRSMKKRSCMKKYEKI